MFKIVNYLDNIVAANPDLASVYTPGFSHENRALKTLVLKTATSTKGVWLGKFFASIFQDFL
jgi:hypothetical protein